MQNIYKELLNNIDNDLNHISINNVIDYILKLDNIHTKMCKKYPSIIFKKIPCNSNIDYDYTSNELVLNIMIPFNIYSSKNEVLRFKKDDNDLYIVSSTCEYDSYNSYILKTLYKEIYTLYDLFKEIHYDYNEYKDLSDINNSFIISLNKDHITIKNDQIYIRKANTYDNCTNTEIDSNSFETIQFVENNITNILKHIYVNIDDLPIWMQENMQNLRKKQLNNSFIYILKRKLDL